MKYLKLTLSSLFCFFHLAHYAQVDQTTVDKIRKNIVYIHVLGDATVLGLNYERLIPTRQNNFAAMKVGAGYSVQLCLLCEAEKYFALSYNITNNVGRNNKKFEYGLGVSQLLGENNITFVYPTIGFRYLSPRPGKVTFRVVLQTPILRTRKDIDHFFTPIGIYVGRQF